MGGKKNLLYSPQALKHMEFLKSVSWKVWRNLIITAWDIIKYNNP
jgi:hypothetical protein